MRRLSLFAVIFLLAACSPAPEPESGITAIVGSTIVDVGDWGNSTNDIPDGVVLLEGNNIIAVGPRDEVEIPAGASLIDASGKYVLPGLIDAFAALNNQSYADAFLYMGVTSIVGLSSARRGDLYLDADPGPAIYKLKSAGDVPRTTDELLADIESLAEDGCRVVLLMYEIRPDQLEAAVERAHSLGLGTIGELGHTTYREGIEAGLDAFVHTTRYSMDIAPRDMAAAVAAQPFSDDLDSPKWRYYKFLTGLDPSDQRLLDHAAMLGGSGVSIMPTLSLLYLDLPDNANPWDEPIAAILDPADINSPADPATGEHIYDPEHAEAYAALAAKELLIEGVYRAAGSHYLAGSATDVWGTMPGISLHTELTLLVRIGLTPRQAIAASTYNVSETFGWKEIGLLEAGRRADILIVDANPLDDIVNLKRINTVIRNGEVIDRQALLPQ